MCAWLGQYVRLAWREFRDGLIDDARFEARLEAAALVTMKEDAHAATQATATTAQ